MMTKTAYYMQMAQEAAAQITGSKEQWTAFLTTSARLYKYPFAEQLMIYKQRPEATACAEYDLWNDRMNRYVKRGSKGIALLDMRGEQPRLRYVFDVADTGERKNSRPVQLWKMNAEDVYKRQVSGVRQHEKAVWNPEKAHAAERCGESDLCNRCRA